MKCYLYQVSVSLALIVCLFFGISGSVQASPLYVTIQGSQHLRMGDPTTYPPEYLNEIEIILMIDSSLQGTYEDGNGISQEYNDYYYNNGLHYADYVYADLIALHTTYDISDWHGTTPFVIGESATNCAVVDMGNGITYSSEVDICKPGDIMIHMGEFTDRYLWTTGLTVGRWAGNTGITAFCSNDNLMKNIWSNNLYIRSVSETNPIAQVPEPSIVILLCSGFIGLACFRKKR